MGIPHPIPYQGSKRGLVAEIFRYFPSDIGVLYEPFAGSAAVSLAAAAQKRSSVFHLNDLNGPLIELWRAIVLSPEKLAKEYEILWHAQLDDPKTHYGQVREEFNRTKKNACMLYLLARCIKASVRYNADGEFNQSPDNRRRGTTPETMRHHLLGASSLLKGKSFFSSVDYRDLVLQATPEDMIYLDPPYQGVCGTRDSRYFAGVRFHEFVEILETLNRRNIRYLVSYDGRTGGKTHGENLPTHLDLTHLELSAGRSSQATLLGRKEVTVESLYLSPALRQELHRKKPLATRQHEQTWHLFEVGT